MSFNFFVNNRCTLPVANEGDLMRALFQIEYIKHTERDTYVKCAKECIQEWHSDDLSQQDGLCLERCVDKSLTVAEHFFDRSLHMNNLM
jgi:hypothetical protein